MNDGVTIYFCHTGGHMTNGDFIWIKLFDGHDGDDDGDDDGQTPHHANRSILDPAVDPSYDTPFYDTPFCDPHQAFIAPP